MNLIVGLLTILIIVIILRLCKVDDIGCMTFLIIVFGLPFIAEVGETVIYLLQGN